MGSAWLGTPAGRPARKAARQRAGERASWLAGWATIGRLQMLCNLSFQAAAA